MDWLWKALAGKNWASGHDRPRPPSLPRPLPRPHDRPVERQRDLFPNTFHQFGSDDQAEQPRMFDPALLHLPNAYRNGDAVVYDIASQAKWYGARRRVIDHVMRFLAASPWADNLVLRGSLLLEAWFPQLARRPGDIDWVVAPDTIQIDDPWARDFFTQFPQMVASEPADAGVEIIAEEIASDEIWTYDRVPGGRITIPWRHSSLPPGVVQLDFVFGERLYTVPIRANIATTDGTNVSVWAATKEESLAWKILWLENDIHPQGKDLYDAVVLAENCYLPFDLLERVREATEGASQIRRVGEESFELFALMREAGETQSKRPTHCDIGLRPESWQQFQTEYPNVAGSEEQWIARLHKALERTFGRS